MGWQELLIILAFVFGIGLLLAGLLNKIFQLFDEKPPFWEFVGIKESPFNSSKFLVVYKRNNIYTIYCGMSTVWHGYPNGERCSTTQERKFGDLAEMAEYKRELGDPEYKRAWTEEEIRTFVGVKQ